MVNDWVLSFLKALVGGCFRKCRTGLGVDMCKLGAVDTPVLVTYVVGVMGNQLSKSVNWAENAGGRHFGKFYFFYIYYYI